MAPEQKESAHNAFRRAVARAGSQVAFERQTGAKQQKVSYWLRDRMILPGEYVLATETAFGISRHELRPDLYPIEQPDTDTAVLEPLR
ncbi:YdaS family helix-turn-helix protein [Sphingomonas sp. TREG-RG-20F-R18-01]|uniref:transcriptional regulator n=1 Tax=Sphingomonas sp. TREG-RG-20F-R18-01 TaxID=2914982 RepID=UPI001F5AA949|nr:YdaS family helix-turn-helix protein [Sphingomonas sp. TREG-RG-20F-R18-01]